jgi:hypothetical protein
MIQITTFGDNMKISSGPSMRVALGSIPAPKKKRQKKKKKRKEAQVKSQWPKWGFLSSTVYL